MEPILDMIDYDNLDEKHAAIITYEGDLETVTIPAVIDGLQVVRINMGAVMIDRTMRKLILPEGMQALDAFALQSCTALETMVLPDSLLRIGDLAFCQCDAMHTIEISDRSPYFMLQDGILYTKDGTELVYCPPALGITAYTVPDTVRVIRGGAFEGCRELEQVILPEGLEEIGTIAFSRTGLRRVELPESLRKLEDFAFAGCDNLRSITFGSRVEPFEGDIVAGCKQLEHIGMDPRNPNFRQEEGVLYNADRTRVIRCAPMDAPQKLELPANIAEISSFAFCGCAALEQITLPDGLSLIGEAAFSRTSLQKITLPSGIRKIRSFTFDHADRLEQVDVPEDLEWISETAFTDCTALKELVIPRTTEIGDDVNGLFMCDARIVRR